MHSGVAPSYLASLTSAPASISARTTTSWPFATAMYRGATLLSLALLTSAPASISVRNTAS